MSKPEQYDQYYLSYTGAQLPLTMVNPLEPTQIENRNTFFGVCHDEAGRVTMIHKWVYGELELAHQYTYDHEGRLECADIFALDEDGRRLKFNPNGTLIADEVIVEA